MDQKYQVFVSSTYRDLVEERQEVMRALLELNCIPAGMELFPAADDDQWTLIRRVIDDCDYYIVIVGGTYGSIGPSGMSYTQMEYEYAVEQGKPIIGFLLDLESLDDVDDREDRTGRDELLAFREVVQRKVCRYWKNPAELGGAVSRSLIQLINDRPAVGWVRGNTVVSEDASAEILQLRNRVHALEAELRKDRQEPDFGDDVFIEGEKSLTLRFSYGTNSLLSGEVRTTWHELLFFIEPAMREGVAWRELTDAVELFVRAKKHESGGVPANAKVSDGDVEALVAFLRAMGLVSRSVENGMAFWATTQFASRVAERLRQMRYRSGTFSAG